MILELILGISMFHHKHKAPSVPVNQEWIYERKYLDRAAQGIQAYENDTLYAQYERPQLDAFEEQFQKCYDEKDSNPAQFIQDMKYLDGLGQVLDSLDKDLHSENVI